MLYRKFTCMGISMLSIGILVIPPTLAFNKLSEQTTVESNFISRQLLAQSLGAIQVNYGLLLDLFYVYDPVIITAQRDYSTGQIGEFTVLSFIVEARTTVALPPFFYARFYDSTGIELEQSFVGVYIDDANGGELEHW